MPTAVNRPPFPKDWLDELRRDVGDFPEGARRRGQAYAREGRIGEIEFEADSFAAAVAGDSDDYRTAWYWEGGRWELECTCPVGGECKHAFALATVMLALGDDRRGDDGGGGSRTPAAAGVDAAGRAALNELQTASRSWEREHALNVLLVDAPVNLSAYLYPFTDILREKDPDLLCWRLAQEIPQRAGGWLPAALLPWRHRPDLLARQAEAQRGALAVELRSWLEQQRRLRPRELRVRLRLDGPENTSGVVVAEAWQLLDRGAPTAPRRPRQLAQLRKDLRKGTVTMSLEQIVLLDWLLEVAPEYAQIIFVTAGQLHRLLRLLPGSSAISWSTEENEELARVAGLRDGATARFDPTPVRLLPALVARAGDSVLELRAVWPDGRHRGLDEMVIVRGGPSASATLEPSLVVADGVVHAVVEEPPAGVFARFATAGFLPIAAEQRVATMGMLATAFPALRATMDAHCRRHDAAPAIAMDLRNDDWMQLRLYAHTGGADWTPARFPEGAVVFEFTRDLVWEKISAPAGAAPPAASASAAGDEGSFETMSAAAADEREEPQPAADDAAAAPPAADPWLEEPEPERVAPALAWFEALRAAVAAKGRPQEPPWSDRDTGWWVLVNPRRLNALAEAWEDRPEGVGFFGTPRIRRLFTGRDAIRARVRVLSSGVDWLTVAADWEVEGRRLSDDDLAMLRAASGRFVKLPSGWARREIADAHDESARLLADVGIAVGEGEQRIGLRQLAGARTESLEALEHFGADPEAVEAVRRMRESIERFEGLPAIPLPPGLDAELRPYQRHGLDFLAHCASLGVGALLADDMGLGKTVQALAWLLYLRAQEPGAAPSLVVAPASVVHNWAREAERFAPAMRPLLLTSGKERHELRKRIGEHDLVVTNYALLRRDIEAWRQLDLHAVILDEAQNIKNPDAAVTRAVRELRPRHRLALTGTPMENRALDLWSIFSFLEPGYLGARGPFAARYDRSDAPPHLRALLSARLRPVLLRRTKAEVAPELPDRIEERVDCEPTRGQRQLYLAELRRSRRLLAAVGAAPEDVQKHRMHILAALTRLRQICCHPALAGGKPSLGSGKFAALFELLEPLLAEGHKVLLFSSFVECLKLLAAEMRERGMPFHQLTGQTTRRERVVEAFEQDERPSVFLISLKAGGTGLNLTSASYVVIFDPWWNPAVEAQAIDRTHRIGQTRTVIAYRLLTLGSIEEKIFELQQRKAQLVRDVLGEGGFARALTREDLEYLLTPEEGEEDDEYED